MFLCRNNADQVPISLTGIVFQFKYYNDVIMSAKASQITGVSIVCLPVGSGEDQRKDQSSASLAFVRGIHRWSVNFGELPAQKAGNAENVSICWRHFETLVKENGCVIGTWDGRDYSNVSINIAHGKYFDYGWSNPIIHNLSSGHSVGILILDFWSKRGNSLIA